MSDVHCVTFFFTDLLDYSVARCYWVVYSSRTFFTPPSSSLASYGTFPPPHLVWTFRHFSLVWTHNNRHERCHRPQFRVVDQTGWLQRRSQSGSNSTTVPFLRRVKTFFFFLDSFGSSDWGDRIKKGGSKGAKIRCGSTRREVKYWIEFCGNMQNQTKSNNEPNIGWCVFFN